MPARKSIAPLVFIHLSFSLSLFLKEEKKCFAHAIRNGIRTRRNDWRMQMKTDFQLVGELKTGKKKNRNQMVGQR